MIYVHKMLFGLVNLNFNDYFPLTVDSITRGHKYITKCLRTTPD